MIKISQLETGYKDFRLTVDNLEIKPGKITFLLGKNGAGKTTLVKTMLEQKRYAGTIEYNEKSFTKVRERIGVVFSEGGLYKHMTGYENCIYFLDEVNNTPYVIEPRLLKKEVKFYSTGEYKKLASNITLSRDLDYLICDEISSGLDYDSIKILKNKLLEITKSGCTVLLTGHQFEFYNDIVDDVIILKEGRVTYSGSCNDLFSEIGYTAEITLETNSKINEVIENQYKSRQDGDKWRIQFDDLSQYREFKKKYIHEIMSITVNENKVGIIYEEYFN